MREIVFYDPIEDGIKFGVKRLKVNCPLLVLRQTFCGVGHNVRFTPESGHVRCN